VVGGSRVDVSEEGSLELRGRRDLRSHVSSFLLPLSKAIMRL
jgi:hypothetical protein